MSDYKAKPSKLSVGNMCWETADQAVDNKLSSNSNSVWRVTVGIQRRVKSLLVMSKVGIQCR